MFLDELKEKKEKPVVRPRRVPGLKMSEKMLKLKNRRLIASPDTVSGVVYISCFIHLKDVSNLSEVRSLGVEIEETFDGLDFVTARVPVNQLERLAGVDNVTLIKVAQQMRPMTDAARQKTNVDDLLTQSNDAITQGITNKYDGTGVVLGIIDTGIDFQHIAFKDKNGNSRIKRAYVYNGSSGTEYTSVTSSSPTTDDNTGDHGTHTASTAGGSSVIVNGSNVTVTDNHANATYGGMAPGADLYLAGVKGLSNTYLSNALKKMVQYADDQGKPLVVSNSWGSGWGPRDGTGEWADLVGQYFGDSHPNHIILFASSNDAGHSKDSEGGGFFVKKSSAKSASPLGTILRSAWYANTDAGYYYSGLISTAWASKSLNCKIYVLHNQTGAVQDSWTVGSSTSSFDGLSTYYDGTLYVYTGSENGKYYLQVYTSGLESESVTSTTKNGSKYYKSDYTLAIEVYPASGSTNVDMWAGDNSYFTNHLSTTSHTWTAGTDDMCVSDEATIPNVISVGAYVSKTDWTASSGSLYSATSVYTMGDIAYFSSYSTATKSPTGLAYPWITAPGARLAAGVNHYHTTSIDDYSYYGSNNYSDLVVNSSSNPYAMMQGTSMATPVAAGIVALWLQAAQSVNKSLTVNDVKDIMAQTAINDSYTTTGTNASHFGKGKIDALAGIKHILQASSSESSTSSVVIGDDATSTGSYAPYYNYYCYSTVQMLYTPEEIGKGGKINSIAFKVASASSFATSEVNVYLGHKSGTFSSASDYVTSNDLTLVYSGAPTLGQSVGWETLTFNQGEFTYNGTDNLVVVVTRKSSNWSSSLKYYYFTGSGYTLYRKSDGTTDYADVTNTSYSYSTSTNRPSIRIDIEESSGIVGIGDNATSSDHYAPYSNYYCNSAVQMLYTPEEIGKSGKINSIAFKVASASSFATSEVNVYLGHKSGTFSSTSDYLPANRLTLVYSGSPTLGQTTGWETLTFNQGEFYYNGRDNLAVVVTRKSDTYTSSLKYYYYTGSGYTLYRRSDGDTGYADVTNTSYSYSTSDNRPSIRIEIEESENGPTYNDGDVFTAYTEEGVEMTFMIISVAEKTCQVGDGSNASASIDQNTVGTITIPQLANDMTVTGIGKYAFYNCSGMTNVVIPNSVKYIGEYSFTNCSNLESVTIPSSVTSIGVAAFLSCPSVTNISVDTSNPVYDSRNDCNAIIESASNTLVFGCKNTIIPYTILSIGEAAFYDCSNMATIELPSSVTTIEDWAFRGCTSLTSFTIPNSVTSIGSKAFVLCTGLTELVIPNSVTSIGTYVFHSCTGLTSITLPASISNISTGLFYNCTGLASISIPSSVTAIGGTAFAECNNLTSVTVDWNEPITISTGCFSNAANATLYVPGGTKTLYEEMVGWNEFMEILELGSVFTITPICGEGGSLQLSSETVELNGSVTITIVPNEEYKLETFTVDGNDVTDEVVGLQYTISNVRKDIEVSATFRSIYDFITISSAGEGTYCSDRDLDFSGVQGLKAYIASGFIKQTGTVMLMRVTDVPAQTGLMVKGTPGTYKVPYAESTAYYVNMLKGNVEPVSVEPTEGVYTNYYLSNGSDGLGFYQIKNTRTMSANRAILQIPTSVVNGARRVNMVFDDDEATGINDASRTNGQKAEKYFNMNGQRIATPKKGLYIKDGKKIIY